MKKERNTKEIFTDTHLIDSNIEANTESQPDDIKSKFKRHEDSYSCNIKN